MNKNEIEVKELVAKKTKNNDYFLVDPLNIIVNEEKNVRTDYGDIEELSESIISVGLIDPLQGIKVRGEDKYILVDGFRRMRAIKMAIERGHSIPYVKLFPTTGNEEDQLFVMLITGVGKKPLTPLEEGEGYKRLVAYGYEPKEIATKVAKSMAHVYNMLKLSDAPKSVKIAIEKGEITATTVTQVIRESKSSDEVTKTVESAIATAKVSGKKTVTGKDVTKVKTPIQKLQDAYALACDKDSKSCEFILDLIDVLNKKDSTSEQIVELIEGKI